MARQTMDELREQLRATEAERDKAVTEAVRLRAVLAVIRAALEQALGDPKDG